MDVLLNQRGAELPPNKNKAGESIFNYYSIPNEVAFLNKISGIPAREQHFYLKKNVERFLGEYVGKVPYTKISYQLKNGELYFGDIPVMRTYKETAEMTPEGSREWAEYEGMVKINAGLDRTMVKSALMISPSKIADYGLGFYFKKNGETVDEYILRYEEGLYKTDASARIYEGVLGEKAQHDGANDFIRNPIFFSNDGALNNILALPDMNITSEVIEKSQRFELMVEKELGYWIGQYSSMIRELALLNPNSDVYKRKEDEAKIFFTAIYNMARDIKKRLDEIGIGERVSLREYDKNDASVIRYYYTLEEKPLVTGGGSCIVTTSNDESGFMSSHSIYQEMRKGSSIENKLRNETCPHCQKSGKDNHYHCPSCNKEYADETHKAVRTPKCACGHMFGC